MSVERATNLLATVTLVELMFLIGLSVTFAQVGDVVRDRALVARSLVANYVLFPACAAALLLLFRPDPLAAAGLLILAVCPGAPYGPPFAAIAKGDVPVATGLMTILAATSALVAPVLLGALVRLVSADSSLNVDATKIVLTLLLSQLLPLVAGLALHEWLPSLAVALQKPAARLSMLLNLAVVVLILAAQYPMLLSIKPRGYAGMLALLAASIAIGWVLGGPNASVRKAFSLTTSIRNAGVGIVIATGAFAGTLAVPALLAYALVSILGSLLLAAGWGRSVAAARQT